MGINQIFLLIYLASDEGSSSDGASSSDAQDSVAGEGGEEESSEKDREQEVAQDMREEETGRHRVEFKEGLVFRVTKHVFDRAEEIINDLASGKSSGWTAKTTKEGPSAAPYAPSLLLLKRLQAYLTRDAACSSGGDGIAILVLYARFVLEKSISLLDSAMNTNAILSG